MVQTTARCMCILKQAENAIGKYTISVDDANIPDFTRTARTGKAGNVSTEHEYQILGLVPGMKTILHLQCITVMMNYRKSRHFSIDIPASQAVHLLL